ncbi:uncharacterized protein LOC121922036 [Sceloporus undulatus]|uniref:uncharacterized protein LOC121922036 n=1 Tax=Sceloporus undulatus TaxID=8520 RepID=UPI001C4C0AD7|nr:uncharacterized protein LOC121922036 [Sceloporus undulatus]
MEDSTKIGGRGASWKPDETRCLIAIWGEETVQMQLSKNHRNICVYDKIASQLRKHGFNRSAGECRTKAKALKRGYKKAVQLSKTSGMGAIDFPFFSELQDVFAGDASIEAKRAAGGNALRFEKKTDTPEMPPETRVLSSTPNASSEDLFTHEAVQEHFVLNLTSVQEEDEDLTQIVSEEEDVGQTGESNDRSSDHRPVPLIYE